MRRRFRTSDIPALKALYEKQGYGFKFEDALPDDWKSKRRSGKRKIAFVIEEEGRIIGFACAKPTAEIVGMVDPDFGSPHRRLKVFAELHLPIAEQLEQRGIKKVTAAVDPKHRGFGRKLSRLGWAQSLWANYWLKVSDVIEGLKG